jgi:hypothetical protein
MFYIGYVGGVSLSTIHGIFLPEKLQLLYSALYSTAQAWNYLNGPAFYMNLHVLHVQMCMHTFSASA